jgi:hypothetical protein
VIRHDGDYDSAVMRAYEDSLGKGWVYVQDTAFEGYTEIPLMI